MKIYFKLEELCLKDYLFNYSGKMIDFGLRWEEKIETLGNLLIRHTRIFKHLNNLYPSSLSNAGIVSLT